MEDRYRRGWWDGGLSMGLETCAVICFIIISSAWDGMYSMCMYGSGRDGSWW